MTHTPIDLLPNTIVSIRCEARSVVYRAALGRSGRAFGFLLGTEGAV